MTFTFTYSLLLCCILEFSSSFDITSLLLKQVQNDSQFRQIVSIDMDEEQNFPIIKATLPCLFLNYRNTTQLSPVALDSFLLAIKNSRSSLFVISPAFNSSNDSDLLEFLANLLEVEQRPKVLFLKKVTDQQGDYKKFLKLMWKKNFLDVSILEFIEKDSNELELLGTLSGMLYYFNPFSARFKKRQISLANFQGELFPDKLSNLHGYMLKVGFFHHPPFVTILRNASNHVVGGADYQLVKILAEKMNFRIKNIISRKKVWDIPVCKREENSGLHRKLIFGEIDFIGVLIGAYFVPCIWKHVKYLVSPYGMIHISAVIPVVSEESTLDLVEWNLSYLLVIIILLLMIYLFARILHFPAKNWRLMNLLGMMLGFCVPLGNSRKSAEMLFFATVFVTCFLNSSVIFTAFTYDNLKKEIFTGIQTLNALYASNFTPVVYSNYLWILPRHSNLTEAQYFRKTLTIANNDQQCLDYLLRHKNITCFMRDAQFDMLLGRIRKSDNNPAMRKLKEKYYKMLVSIKCKPGSPYVAMFEKILFRIPETGIPVKWNKKYFSTSIKKSTNKETYHAETYNLNSNIRESMYFILIIGFSCSILTFMFELILHFASEKLHFFE